MTSWFQHLRQRWNDWCGDHDMEVAIRQQLSEEGFYGGTAKLRNVRCVAVQRPGWLQVFRFDATARLRPTNIDHNTPDPEAEYRELFGLVRDDIRRKMTDIKIFEDETGRRVLFQDWSEDLICLRGAQGLTNR